MSEMLQFIVVMAVFLAVVLLFFRGEAKDEASGSASKARFEYQEMVTIASYLNPGLAHVAKSKLESEGIDSFIANDKIWGIDFTHVLTDSGLHLRVKATDVDAAREILLLD